MSHFIYIYYNIARKRLLEYLPESERTSIASNSTSSSTANDDETSTTQEQDLLRSTIHSPQLSQAIEALSEALNSENFNSILSSFNIDPSPGMTKLVRRVVYFSG